MTQEPMKTPVNEPKKFHPSQESVSNQSYIDQSGYDKKPAEEQKPQISEADVAAVKTQITEIDAKIKVLQNEVDNNFNLTNLKIREKKREINHLQSSKNALEKSII